MKRPPPATFTPHKGVFDAMGPLTKKKTPVDESLRQRIDFEFEPDEDCGD
jgi:hypothetical protein